MPAGEPEANWTADISECDFYQNSVDTVFVCGGNAVYVLPREQQYL